MNIFAITVSVLESTAPIFILALIGWLWVRLGYEYRVQFVTRLSMTLSVPCLIFMALVRSGIEPSTLRDTAMAAAAAYCAVALAAWALIKWLGLSQRVYLAPLVFGNTGNIGLPLALFAFGTIGLDFAVVIFAVMAVMSFSVGVWIVSGSRNPTAALKEPMVWATLLGALFLYMSWGVPLFMERTLDTIGQIAIPVMLITLGAAIYRLQPAQLGRAFWLSLLKLALCIGVAVGMGYAFDLPAIAFAALVVQLATPVAVTSYMLAEKYNASPEDVAGLVVVSTLVSVGAIPIMLAVLLPS